MNEKTRARTPNTPSRDTRPFVSVVVATIGRGQLLIQTVRELLENDYPCFEIIVVDQTERPQLEVLRFMKDNATRVTYLKKERPGLPDARNTGIAAARGDVVLFVDDDVEVPGAFIAAHAAAYGDDGVGGVAGRVIPPGDAPKTAERRSAHIAKIRLGGLVIRDNFDADTPTRADHVRGCNMSFLKHALDKAGGFDGRFGGSAHLEETDMALRVRAAGYRLVFEPAAVLIHLLEPVGGCRPKTPREWFFWYGHNCCLFYLKNFPRPVFPVLAAAFAARLPFSAAKSRNPGVIAWAAEGFLKGFTTYRRAGR